MQIRDKKYLKVKIIKGKKIYFKIILMIVMNYIKKKFFNIKSKIEFV